MKSKMLRMIALMLIIALVLPVSSVSAASGMTLYVEDERAESVELCVGETVEFECWFQSWASSLKNMGANHFVAGVSTRDYNGGNVYVKGNTSGLSRGSLTGTIKGQKTGKVAVTVTITAGYSCDPRSQSYPVNVYDKISKIFYVYIEEECRVDEPEVDPDDLLLPEINMCLDGELNGEDGEWIVNGQNYTMDVGEKAKFYVGVYADKWEADTKTINGIEVTTYFYPDGNGGYFCIYVDGIKWRVDNKGEVRLDTGKNGTVTVKNESKTEAKLGTLVFEVPLIHIVKNGTCYRVDSLEVTRSESVNLSSEGQRVIIENPLEDIEVDKVPNPFTDVNESDWYYDSFMKVYAAGWLHGVDISPEQDGSQIIYMEKNALKHGESKVSMQILTAEEWMKKAGIKYTSFGGDVQLSLLGNLGGAELTLLAQQNSTPSVTAGVGVAANRSSAVTSIYRSSGQTASYNTNPFTDVPMDRPFAQPVLWAANTGVVNGYGGGIFGPYNNITREQMCAIFVRLAGNLGKTLPQDVAAATFTDGGRIQGYARDAVTACQRAGIVKGDPGGTFRPQANITFAELTQMIVNFRAALAR